MRLLIFLSCALALFSLASCALPFSEEARGKEILEGFTQTYQADITLAAGNLALRAGLSSAPGSCRVVIIEPRSLAGYSYLFREGGVDISYNNLTFSLNAGAALPAAPLAEAANALSALLLPQPGALPKQKDGYWELSGEIDGAPCALWIDGENGIPIKLLLHDGEMEIKLQNFSFSG